MKHHILKRGILPAFTLLLAADAAVGSPAETTKLYVLPTIPKKTEVVTIEKRKIVTNLGTQPRVATDPDVVAEYHELIKEAKAAGQPYPLPPVQGIRTPEGKIILWDGFQRLEANEGVHSDIDIEVREGTEEMAVILSLGANAAHGARRTSKDKRNAVKRAFQDPNLATLTDGAIAELCAVSPSLVRLNRPAIKAGAVRVNKAGKTMNTAAIGKGKGGGAKGKKAAAKAAKKAGKKAPAKKDANAGVQKAQQRQSELLGKIVKNVGGSNAIKIRDGVLSGALDLTPRDLTDFAAFSPETSKAVAELVISQQMKPWKAMEFYKSEPTEKVLTDLQLRAISHGGTYEFNKDGLKLVVTYTPKK